MKAAVCPAHGPPSVLEVREVAAPDLPGGHLRVRVTAAAVNYPDVLLIAGRYQVSVAPPFVPGSEFAGVVSEIGCGVVGFAVGDRVTGTAMVGAFAETVVADPVSVRRIPDGVDDHAAAAFGVAHRTAYHALRSVARVGPGDEVIVLGAGGGVGLAAVQLAARLGAEVTAVASSADKLAAAAQHGARHLVDHTKPSEARRAMSHRSGPLREALRDAVPGGAAAVIDPVGGDLSEPALRALHRGGRFVTVGFASGVIPRIPLNLVLMKGVVVQGFQFGDIPADEFSRNEAELADLLATGGVRPHIGAVHSLDEVAAAVQLVADGKAVGKIVIQVAPAEDEVA